MSLADRPATSRTHPPRAAARPPGETGLWLFLLADMTVFAMFFGAYLWEAGDQREAFAVDAGALVLPLGLANVLVLLTSSYVVVRAVEAHRADDRARVRRLLAFALAGAGLFAVAKVLEYALELVAGHGLTSSGFFMYYFVLTGLHLMHVAIGAVLLAAWRRSCAAGVEPYPVRWAEGVGGYWHMVDLLWILIFSFVYLGSHA